MLSGFELRNTFGCHLDPTYGARSQPLHPTPRIELLKYYFELNKFSEIQNRQICFVSFILFELERQVVFLTRTELTD